MTNSLPGTLPLLDAIAAQTLLEALDRGDTKISISLDLGKTVEDVQLESDAAILNDYRIVRSQLEKIRARDNIVFALRAAGPEPLETRERGYAKLVPTGGAPTIELSGVRMHRTAGIDPFEDARTKVATVIRPGDIVLDTCGGLGYTAIWARKQGASRVTSVEIDPAVLRLRRFNPWSLEYLRDESTIKLEGDIAEQIENFADGSFTTVLHDPPRFSLAGDLYGARFISQMHRILAPSGRLMFYTGEPYRSGRGREFVAGVGRRLNAAGFRAEWRREVFSFVTRRE